MTSASTLFMFLFSSTFVQSLVSILMKKLKYFFNWGNYFWLFLLWVSSLEFLPTIIFPTNWSVGFNLEIPSWLFWTINFFFSFCFSLSCGKLVFYSLYWLESLTLQTVLEIILIGFLNLYFVLIYLLHY